MVSSLLNTDLMSDEMVNQAEALRIVEEVGKVETHIKSIIENTLGKPLYEVPPEYELKDLGAFIGTDILGSEALAAAVEYMEYIKPPHWVRGSEGGKVAFQTVVHFPEHRTMLLLEVGKEPGKDENSPYKVYFRSGILNAANLDGKKNPFDMVSTFSGDSVSNMDITALRSEAPKGANLLQKEFNIKLRDAKARMYLTDLISELEQDVHSE